MSTSLQTSSSVHAREAHSCAYNSAITCGFKLVPYMWPYKVAVGIKLFGSIK